MKIQFKKIDNDSNGNPRYVFHFLNLSPTYEEALKLAKQFGGRKFHNKQCGGGIVIQSYNIYDTEKRILKLVS
jgi:hypothetical protein